MRVTETLARLRQLSPHAFSGDNRIAAEYVKHRAEGLGAMYALQWARQSAASRAFEWQWNSESNYRTSHCNDSPLAVYERESASGRLRVELAFIGDDAARDDDDSEETADSLYTFFRTERKLGKVQARDAARADLERIAEYKEKRQRGGYETIGVSVRVFWNVPKLDAGEPIAESSCWGFETADSDSAESWNFARDIYCDAIGEAIRKLRSQHRLTLSWAKQFGFTLPGDAH